MTENQKYWLTLITSLIVAWMGWSAPNHRMPVDYGAMISRSVPSAVAWAAILGFFLWRFRMRGLCLLLGAPMALYWPIWLLFHQFPPCYYANNCA
jgi:hypothetical protein